MALLVILTKQNLVLNDPVPVVCLLPEIRDVSLQLDDGLLEALLLLLQCVHLMLEFLNLLLGAATQVRLSFLTDMTAMACFLVVHRRLFSLHVTL